MFQSPTGSATPDSIYGLWGGLKKDGVLSSDTRMRFSKDSAIIAMRCRLDSNGKASAVVSVASAARVMEESIVLLDSKTDRNDDLGVPCVVNVSPREVKRCAASVTGGFEHDCFKVEGTQLTDYGMSSFDAMAMTKLSD